MAEGKPKINVGWSLSSKKIVVELDKLEPGVLNSCWVCLWWLACVVVRDRKRFWRVIMTSFLTKKSFWSRAIWLRLLQSLKIVKKYGFYAIFKTPWNYFLTVVCWQWYLQLSRCRFGRLIHGSCYILSFKTMQSLLCTLGKIVTLEWRRLCLWLVILRLWQHTVLLECNVNEIRVSIGHAIYMSSAFIAPKACCPGLQYLPRPRAVSDCIVERCN